MPATTISPPRSYSLHNMTGRSVQQSQNTLFGFPPSVPSVTELSGLKYWDKIEGRITHNTPSYVFAVAFGNLPFNSFGYQKTEDFWYFGYRNYKQITWYGWYSEYYVGGNGSSVGDSRTFVYMGSLTEFNLENQAKQKILEKLQDQDVNLAQVWAERDQTLRLIATTVKRLRQVIDRLKKGDFVGAAGVLGISPRSLGSSGGRKRQSRSVARGWLELQYGWKPLLSDIYGSVEHLQKSFKKKEYLVFHAAKRQQESWDLTKVDAFTNVHDQYSWTDSLTKKVTLKVRRSSTFLAELSSLGITNPVNIAWELTPYSFVFDWMVPIGSFLKQFDANLGWDFTGAAVTTFRTTTFRMDRSSGGAGGTSGPPAGYEYYFENGSKHSHQVTCNRDPYLGFSSLLSVPAFKNPLSLLHASEAVSLFAVRRGAFR